MIRDMHARLFRWLSGTEDPLVLLLGYHLAGVGGAAGLVVSGIWGGSLLGMVWLSTMAAVVPTSVVLTMISRGSGDARATRRMWVSIGCASVAGTAAAQLVDDSSAVAVAVCVLSVAAVHLVAYVARQDHAPPVRGPTLRCALAGAVLGTVVVAVLGGLDLVGLAGTSIALFVAETMLASTMLGWVQDYVIEAETT